MSPARLLPTLAAVREAPGAVAPVPRAWAAAWHRHLGRPAAVALVLVATAALMQWQWRPRLVQEQARLAQRTALLAALPAGPAPSTSTVTAPVTDLLPTTRQRGADLEAIVDAAQRAGLGLERADYAAAAPGPGGVLRVDATLPLTGSYGALRAFVADVLNGLPHAALESLQIERANAQAAQLQATARLVLFYREGAR